ncbi:acyl-CoA dehydrogenase family protein [Massilia sp. DWR3-1-1]|uniref:acyl-CoA dehydrogenase family protein n=1 Tax=Massilia sp. DWR3-1-1 TaxID=2804559 RepID=UPI003CF50856
MVSKLQEKIVPNTMAAPEPDLTADELVARAVALRGALLEGQAAAEERGTYSPEMHAAFEKAGFYRTLQPRRYGGYEFGVPTFARMVMEVARGCPGSAWCLALSSGHSLNVAQLFGERAQEQAFGPDGHFAAAARAIPSGTATHADGGWRLQGTWDYCSGVPYSTHVMVGVRIVGEDGPPQVAVALVPRDQWTMLDNWGGYIGMRASGSNSVVMDGAWIPEHLLVREDFFAPDLSQGTEGARLHGNPMYAGGTLGFFQTEISSIIVGLGYAALDEYEKIISARKAFGPNAVLQSQHPDYQRPYGIALGKLEAARHAVLGAAQEYMDLARLCMEGERTYLRSDDMRLQAGMQQAAQLSFEAVDMLYRAAATSASAKNGTRMQRYFRDISMARTNPGLQFELKAADLARQLFSERTQSPAGQSA